MPCNCNVLLPRPILFPVFVDGGWHEYIDVMVDGGAAIIWLMMMRGKKPRRRFFFDRFSQIMKNFK
jgi:hypothetical protein